MKLIYVGKKSITNRLKSLFDSNNVEVIHYSNPLKAMDNFDEILPEIIYMIENDFPRIWKILLTELKKNRNLTSCSFILEGELEKKQYDEFNFLKGDIITLNLDETIIKIKELCSNKKKDYKQIYFPNDKEISIGFMNPLDFSFISGNVEEITDTFLFFKPENIENILSFQNLEISNASLGIKETVFNIDFKIEIINNRIKCIITNNKELYLIELQGLFV
ncbi:MAG: hypothetical protein JXR64_06235 [Spirochaetales bacterium]|nr:hypothetical protein [Spirochaetales bacterium]